MGYGRAIFAGERSEGSAPWATAVRSLTGCRRRGWGRRLPPGMHSGRAAGGRFFAGSAAFRTTDEAHNDSPACRATASPGKSHRVAFSGPRADEFCGRRLPDH